MKVRSLGLALALFALACDDGSDTDEGDEVGDSSDTGSDTSSDTGGMTEGPTWEDDIAEIFVARCVSCHEWADDYDVVIVGLDQTRFKLENGHGDLTQEELDVVLAWIDNGAPQS
jgi:hypothetical protein